MSTQFSLVYGEDTSIALTITAAAFHVRAAQGLALVDSQFTVVNDSVPHDSIEAALRFPLPNSDATICGFSVGPDRAIALPKAKAAEVAHKEKEKGRAVASAKNVSGAVWETSVYPLPYRSPTQISIQMVCSLEPNGELHLPLTFAVPCASIRVVATS